MNDALISFIFALVLGKSIRGGIPKEGSKRELDIWDDEESVKFYISIFHDTFLYRALIEAANTHNKKRASAI